MKYYLRYLNISVLLLLLPSVAFADAEYSIGGSQQYEKLGFSVATIGDVDDDTFDDFVVGSPGYNSSTGKVTVYSGYDGEFIRTINGTSAGDNFGYSVSAVGDINLDTVPDFIVGAPGDVSGNHGGYIKIISGSSDHVIRTVSMGSDFRFGHAVSGIGDINDDDNDVPDFIVSAPRLYQGIPSIFGKVFVLSGSDGTTIYSYAGSSIGLSGKIGGTVANAGDVNNDGYNDFIIGTSTYSPQHWTQVYSGKTGSALSARLCTNSDTTYPCGGEYAQDVKGIGDIDGDGDDDFAVGVPGDTDDPGYVQLRSGDDFTVIDYISKSENKGDGLGFSISNLGDVNGDNVNDIAVGDSIDYISTTPYAYVDVYSGSSRKRLYSVYSPEKQNQFGYSLANIGDINNDGKNDLAIGAPYDGSHESSPKGRVYVFTVSSANPITKWLPIVLDDCPRHGNCPPTPTPTPSP